MKYERQGNRFIGHFKNYGKRYSILAQYESATGYIRITELSNDDVGRLPLSPNSDSHITFHDAYVACIRHLNKLTRGSS